MSRPPRGPVQQGRIDGLCSIYSVLNACKLLFDQTEKQDEKLLKHLSSDIGDLFPQIVWDGAGVPTIYRLLRSAEIWAQKTHKTRLHWRAPLMRGKIARVDTYFDRLAQDLPEPHTPQTSVWIVGLGEPWHHWTVVRGISGETIYFYDSWGMRRYRRSSFTFDEDKAGEGKGKKIKVDWRQSFLAWVE